MTINEFLISCGVNAPKLAEYLKEKYFAEDETPRRKEWSTRSVHAAKTFESHSVVLIKDAWWDRGTGIGRSNFFLAVDESTGRIYLCQEIDYRDQYREKDDHPDYDFHEIKNLVERNEILIVEVMNFRGGTEHLALRPEGSSKFNPHLYNCMYRGEIFWDKPGAENIQFLVDKFSRFNDLLVSEWEVSIGGVHYWPSLGMSLSAKRTRGLKSLEQIMGAVEKACLDDKPCKEKHVGLEVSPRCISLEKLLGKGGE